jgi:ribonuclease T1
VISGGSDKSASALAKLGLALFIAIGGFAAAGGAHARAPVAGNGLATVALADLPPEARRTEQLIRNGGPFPHGKDGTVFGNRERMLPREKRGYYREYTVKTPGSRDRGARRIVCGGTQPTAPEACYYTSDHYSSFKRIVQ